MVRLGYQFINFYWKRKKVGLELVKPFISPENNAGIWHGSGVKKGHIETFSGKKTKRLWKPNVIEREYHSDLLDEKIKTTFTVRATREIHRAGGFDNYILNTSDKKLTSNYAIALKRKMETVKRMQEYSNEKTIDEIKQEIEPVLRNKHKWVARNYTNRFYFDWRGRKQMIFC